MGLIDPLVTTVRFHCSDVKAALAKAEKRGFDSLWLLRTQRMIYITASDQDWRVYPHLISKVHDQLLSPKPQPYVEVIPFHNCVLRKIDKATRKEADLMWFEVQYNDINEYRIHLIRSAARTPVQTSVPPPESRPHERIRRTFERTGKEEQARRPA
jgi:hypothetical protein